MLHEVDLHLAERIAAIALRGGDHLRASGRRAALARAMAVTMPLLILAPALAFVLGWFAPLRWPLVLGSALLLPALAFAATLYHGIRRLRVDRDAALALFDRTLALKDRVTTADQFLHDADANPFKAAALAEAAPWIARASAASLPPRPDAPVAHGTRYALIAGALLLACAAQQHWLPATAETAMGRALASAGIAAPGVAAPVAAADAGDGPGRRAMGRDGHPDATTTPATGSAGGQGRAGDGAGREADGAGRVGTADGFATPTSSQASGASAARSGGKGGGDSAAADAASASDPADPAVQAQTGRTGSARGDRGPSDRQPTTASRGSQQPGAAASQSPSASPLSGQQRPQTGNGGNGNQRSQGRNEQTGNNSQPGQGKGQGRNGQRDGQDSLKRANGIAAMLLAVPMTDRLGGTANPGLVTSQPQRVPPHAGRSGDVAAGNRGVGSGDAGSIPHRPVSAQERRIVRDYFRPRGTGK